MYLRDKDTIIKMVSGTTLDVCAIVCVCKCGTELQQQCDVEASAAIELEAEKTRVSLIPQTDPEYARSSAFITSLLFVFYPAA